MLYTDETTKRRRAVVVTLALLLAGLAGSVASAQQQNGGLQTLPPLSAKNNGARLSALGLQPVLQRAAAFQRASQIGIDQAPSSARVSFSAAHQAFGDLLSTLGTSNQFIAGGNTVSAVSSQQAVDDVRALRNAANRAKDVSEGNRLNKAAALYATGAKNYLIGQLREALQDTGTSAHAVVLRGDPNEADAATQKQTAPPPPTPDQPAPPPMPQPPAPVPPAPPAPNQPAPNQPAPNQPPPNPNPAPNTPDPNNPPVPAPPGVPPPNNPPS